MKTHTNNFKNNLIKFGRELDSKITYTQNGTQVELGVEDLNSITPHYEGGILKSVMKQLDIDSNVEIPLGTILTYQFGVKVGNQYEYINFGNYIVYKAEKQEDTNSWQITCYDKMLYAMKDYENLGVTYPITVRNYINALCNKIGLTFKNASGTFANYNKTIPNELYLDENGKSLGYTFRDVLDELAQVTASTICINENDDELEIRYINNTNDTIDEEYLKDVNVNFGKSYGPINTIVLSRSAGADNIYYPATLPQNPKEIKITDNQIMNGNNRDTYMPDIYNKLNGLEYYINDFSSTGICYYNLCDRYNVSIGNQTYSCVMFNDEVNVTQGLEENVYTEMPEDAETDYKKSDTTDRRINQTTLIVDKQQSEITALVSTTQDIQKEINPTQDATGTSFYLEDSTDAELVNFELEGKTTQETRSGKNILPSLNTTRTINGITFTKNNDGSITINGTATANAVYPINVNSTSNLQNIPIKNNTQYTLSCEGITSGMIMQAYYNATYYTAPQTFTSISTVLGAYVIVKNGKTINNVTIYPQIEEGTTATEYEQYGAMPSPDYPSELVSVGYKNYFEAEYLQTTANTNINANLYKNTYTLSLETKQNFGGVIYIQLYKNNTLITTNGHLLNTSSAVSFSTSSYWYYFQNIPNGNKLTFTLDDDYSLKIALSNATGSQKAMLVKGTQEHSYIPYGKYGIEVTTRDNENNSKTYLYTLNQPLRSIGDTKDLLYIKNGMLYVERKIGSVVFKGTETWNLYSSNTVRTIFYTPISQQMESYTLTTDIPKLMSSHFIPAPQNATWKNGDISRRTNENNIYLIVANGYTIDTFKTWLSTHNTEVQYILAEPTTEELEKVDIPSTYKTITHINTTDELEPNMNITYVRDTQLTNYVEQHISQIIVNEEGITQRVQTIEDSDYNSRLNAVETQQTSTDFRINAISKNVTFTEFDEDGNPINSNINSVTTTTGFTFNENGLNIKKSDTDYNTLIDNTGTYYKDGETIISMTNKDGFLAKDFRLQGQHYYSYNATNPSEPLASENYDFVDERIEVEVDGQTQYAYATFYNGEV